MMKLEMLEEFSGSSDQMIVKGKRTKRPRPSSSASSTGGAAAEFYGSLVSSPATSSGISTSTEEDEDMANCLILLARGNSPPQPDEIKSEEAAAAENKFSSRKFAEMATTAAGKVGIFVYECKTCNRAFPSFQALGGHRASHKRHKTAVKSDQRKSPPPAAAAEEEGEGQLRKPTALSPPITTQSQSKNSQNDPTKPRMHECSICGSEFGSGQALGGHMRRHRPALPPPPPPPTTSVKAPTIVDNETSSHEDGEKAGNIFALDLNLPAPPEDEKLPPPPPPPPPHVVFSAAALVDCHYVLDRRKIGG